MIRAILILFACLWAIPVHAAYTCNVTATGNAAAGDLTTVTSASFNSTGKDIIIASVALYAAAPGGETSPTFTDNQGNPYTEVTSGTASQLVKLRMYYTRPATTSATHTVTYDNGTTMYPTVAVLACSGSSDTPIDQVAFAAKNLGTTITSTVTPSTDNAVVVTVIAQRQTGTMSLDGGFSTPVTVAYSSGRNWGIAQAFLVQTTATVAAPTWTTPNDDTAMVIVSFKSTGGVPCTGVP